MTLVHLTCHLFILLLCFSSHFFSSSTLHFYQIQYIQLHHITLYLSCNKSPTQAEKYITISHQQHWSLLSTPPPTFSSSATTHLHHDPLRPLGLFTPHSRFESLSKTKLPISLIASLENHISQLPSKPLTSTTSPTTTYIPSSPTSHIITPLLFYRHHLNSPYPSLHSNSNTWPHKDFHRPWSLEPAKTTSQCYHCLLPSSSDSWSFENSINPFNTTSKLQLIPTLVSQLRSTSLSEVPHTTSRYLTQGIR